MNKIHLTEVGKVLRSHGVNGEVQVLWDDSFDPIGKKIESVFLLIEGIPIPFGVISIRSKGESSSIVKLVEMETAEMATEFVGTPILVPKSKHTIQEQELYLDDLIGYTIISTLGTQLGIIRDLQDFSGNTLFIVEDSAGQELLIPAVPELIDDLNEETHTLVMQIPKGLTDL